MLESRWMPSSSWTRDILLSSLTSHLRDIALNVLDLKSLCLLLTLSVESWLHLREVVP